MWISFLHQIIDKFSMKLIWLTWFPPNKLFQNIFIIS
jgi:hypothetical protein